MGSGYEIAYTGGLGEDLTGKLVVYLDYDPNPMTADAWATYVPPTGYSLNTPRTTCFDVLELLGSPDVPIGEYTRLMTSDGYTWVSVAALARSIYPYVPITIDGVTLSPQQIAYSLSTPPDGVIIVDSNDKNHANTHWGLGGDNRESAHLQYFLDSRTKCNAVKRLSEKLVRCLEPQSLSRAIIQQVLNNRKFGIGHR